MSVPIDAEVDGTISGRQHLPAAGRWPLGVRLPRSLADFDRRGFRTDRPDARELLEGHAQAFIAGFDLASSRWSHVHEALADVPAFERGFAYEGAAMYAALRDAATFGRAQALAHVLRDAGDGYAHLVHVGYGWGLGPLRSGWFPRLPDTPLLRWLALDGAGFCHAFFGGLPAVRRLAAAPATLVREARLAGCGRALWFIEAADVRSVAAAIAGVPASAQRSLWAGVGLAVAYAGGAVGADLDDLADLGSRHRPGFGQGVLFGAAARARAGIVPPYTNAVCVRVLGIDAHEAGRLADRASADLGSPGSLADFLEWKTRLQHAVADVLDSRGA
ncbi:DUF1702 family protein [Blastococcus montanus]|uniref:DUF1702 family protein n=1 Tax=Blastococcus montanus TaxID=3144973 RepID=UPI00320978BC